MSSEGETIVTQKKNYSEIQVTEFNQRFLLENLVYIIGAENHFAAG